MRLSRSISIRKLSSYGFAACLPTSQRVPPVAIGTRNRPYQPPLQPTIRASRTLDLCLRSRKFCGLGRRDSSGFLAADEKVKAYLSELERRALEGGAAADVELLKTFRQNLGHAGCGTPMSTRVISEPKGFQRVTAEAAFITLTRKDGPRRAERTDWEGKNQRLGDDLPLWPCAGGTSLALGSAYGYASLPERPERSRGERTIQCVGSV